MNTDNLELASTRSRALAFVIDDFLITFVVVLMYWNNIAATGNDLVSILVIMNEFVWQILLLKFIYQTFFCMVLWSNCG